MGRVSSRAVSSWSRSPGCCGFRGGFRWGGFFCVFFSFFFPLERTRPAASKDHLASFTSLLVMRPFFVYRQNSLFIMRPFLAYRQKSLFIPGLCVLSVCITFVVFTDCESCTRPISTNPVSMEAGEYGLTRGTCFVARRLEVVAVAGLL